MRRTRKRGGGYETIQYGRMTIHTLTLPKHTILFRLTSNPSNDLEGVLTNGVRCVIPNFNVYFYPNPFAAELAFQKYLGEFDDNVYAYELEKDVRVVMLLNPSKYNRHSRTQKNFLKPCSEVRKGCMPRELKKYDICLEDEFIETFPWLVGILSNPVKDFLAMKKELDKPANEPLRKYFHYARDSSNMTALPELALHPFASRTSSVREANYSLLRTFRRGDPAIFQFMDSLTYNPDTFFYTSRKTNRPVGIAVSHK